ncbi:MAG: HlyC/CorC family transporter [Chloroflexi bacterium]|nr:HlyC/CorC family transporter [Chloroflexota bacterium]
MPTVGFEVLIVIALILFNGLLAMSEMAIVSSRKVRLQQRAEAGDAGARAALEVANQPTRFLSTVQIGITLVGILAGAFGGATLAETIADRLTAAGISRRYADPLSVGLVVLGITYLSLIIGELVPKRLALHSPERVAAKVARPMRILSTIASPAVAFLSLSTDLVLRLFGIRQSEEPPVTEEEVKLLIRQSTEAGVFELAEQEMVTGVFRLGDRTAGDLMTPRTLISWIDVDDPPEVNWREMVETRHTLYPVCKGDLDNVVGVVSVKDLWVQMIAANPPDIQAALRPPVFVPETMPVLQALELFKQSGTFLALVVDEYGGTAGLLTITDVLEAIVGDIPSPDETPDPPAVQRDDGSWLLDGMLPVEDVKDLLRLRTLPNEENYQTLGGFVMQQLGRIPHVADHFTWDDLRFEVMDMDGNRVDKVLVAPASQDRGDRTAFTPSASRPGQERHS